MEEMTKTTINKKVWKAIDDKKDFENSYLLKGTDTIVNVSIFFEERETFTDANGVKWVRA